VPPPAAREATRTQAFYSSRADTADPGPGPSTDSPGGGSAMRPAPPLSYAPSTPALGGV
jgi:hypothetical protein